jgi:hypothetical protein
LSMPIRPLDFCCLNLLSSLSWISETTKIKVDPSTFSIFSIRRTGICFRFEPSLLVI